ncbi:MAG TPA: hypothetical protein VM865_08800, partial [Acidobacteriaceae bacterium]|nr:hypothetical protein [Acidobacteriaceae bacterium]
MPDEPQRRVLRTTEELEGFAPQWAELWRRDAGATPFQSPEWLLPWWHQFGQPDLRAVVLERSGRAVGFLPFYVYREPESGARQLLPVGVATTDYLDGVFAPECTVADVRAGIDALREEGGWEEMTVAQLRPGSKLGAALAGVEGVRRFAGESCWRRAAVRIAELPPKIRRNATYYRIRALREGT